MLLAGALSVLANLLLVAVRRAITHASWVDALGQSIAWNDHYDILGGTHPTVIAVFAIGCLGFSALMSRYVNINTFSLHGMYRARLVRAYLGASNPRRDAEHVHRVRPRRRHRDGATSTRPGVRCTSSTRR